MTTEEVKVWLRSYRYLKGEAERLEEELLYWRSKSEKMTRAMSGMPSGSGGEDQVSGSVEKIMELENRLEDKLSRMVKQRNEIEKIIDSLPEQQKQILYARYISCLTWDQVSQKMHFDYRWVLRLHKKALQAISKLTIESHY